MKRLIVMLALAAPAIGLIGCQDNSELEDQIAELRSEVKGLKSESEVSNESDNKKKPVNDNYLSSKELAIRLESTQGMLRKAEDRIAILESRPVASDTVSSKSKSTDEGLDTADEGSDSVEAEFDTKIADALKRLDDKNKADRENARTERMAEISKIAKENGLEFDKDNPRKSMMDIFTNPEKRKKAFGIMQGQMDKRRLAPLNLSEQQTEDVLRIEKDFRDRTKEATSSAAEHDATPEQLETDLKYLQEDKDREMQAVLDQEQYDKYKKDAEGGPQMPDMKDIAKMIPGMGGGMPGGDQ